MVPDDDIIGQRDDADKPRPQADGPDRLTRRERRRRWILLAILLLLLLLLAYTTYYFVQNRRLPLTGGLGEPEFVEPPQYLYSITGEGENRLDIPLGVDVADDGRVYVVDFARRRVSVFTNNGGYLFSFDSLQDGSKLGNPVQIHIAGDEVWVSDRRLRTIEVFDLDGEHLRTFDPGDEEDFDWSPMAMQTDADGGVWVTDVGGTTRHRLHYFSEEGSRSLTIGRTVQADSLEDSPEGFFFPTGVALSADGRVYVSDGNNRWLQVFNTSGEFQAFVDTSGIPRGIAIDEENRIYVVDAAAHNVEVYDLEGTRITGFGGRGIGAGQFNYPNYVALDDRPKIYVSDRENDQVQVWGWPTAEPPLPPLAPGGSPLWWSLCAVPPLLLLPLLLLRRRRVVVTPDFMEVLIAAEYVEAVSKKRRLRLVAPVEDRPVYAGRTEQGVELEKLIAFEEYSESDAQVFVERFGASVRDAMLLSMAERAKALATEDLELRALATSADVRAVNVGEFMGMFVPDHRS